MQTQAILASKIHFIGITSTEFTHIVIENNSVVIKPITRQQFLEIIKEDNLKEAPSTEYKGIYDPELGKIYVDDKFQSIVNSNKSLKNFILTSLEDN